MPIFLNEITDRRGFERVYGCSVARCLVVVHQAAAKMRTPPPVISMVVRSNTSTPGGSGNAGVFFVCVSKLRCKLAIRRPLAASGGRRRPSDFHADFFGDFTRKISSFFREGRLEKGFWRPPAANDFFVNLREFLSSGPTRRSRTPQADTTRARLTTAEQEFLHQHVCMYHFR